MRRRRIPDKLSLPEFLEPPPPVESVRVELLVDPKGGARMKLVLVCPNGFIFEDEAEVNSFVVEWRFDDGIRA